MRVILFGATGMIGQGVLQACLASDDVEAVLLVGRTASGVTHPKVRELVHADLFDYSAIAGELRGWDACLFCLGVSSGGLDEAGYTKITYELTLAAARAVLAASPAITFIYVSGAGTDATERGRSMWARVKGKTENDLLKLGFKRAFMFRPGFIRPLGGIKSKTRSYRILYAIFGPLAPLFGLIMPKWITDTDRVARAMLAVAREGYQRPIVETTDINAIAISRGRTPTAADRAASR